MDSEFATGAKSANEQAADAAKDLPLEERLVHTQWKVRQLAYTDFAKALPLLEAHEFGKFADMLPRMASDSNAAALDSGVSALCTFFKEVPLSSMQYLNDERNAVVSSAVEKGLVSTKPGTRTNSLELILTVAEADSPQPVVETIMNGLWTHKTPKVVTAAVSAVRECVHAFGSKTMKLKPIVEQMPKLFGHTDKNVRAEAQKLAIEMYRWLGDPLLTLLEDGGQLKPVQVTELKDACNTLNKDEPVKQARLLRSQVLKEREMQEQATSDDSGTGNNNNDNDAGEADEGNAGEDLFDPVKVLHLLPEEFNSEATSTKWAERKKAMTDLAEVLKPPKLDTGDNYSEIVELLSKRIADVNINVCIAAAECVTKLANGLRSAFNNYRSVITPPIIERLKERKATVIDALKSALDAISQSAGDGAISDMIESVTSSRSHKNPQVRSEMQRWLSRTLSKVKLIPTKGESKQIIEMTMGVLDDSDADVREAGYEVIGTLMKCVGEPLVKAVLPSEFDNKKMEKIIDYCSKATVVAKPPKAAAPPPRQPAPKPSMPSGNDDGMAPPKRSIPPALARRLGAKVDTDDSGNSDSSPPAPKPPALKPAAKPPLPKPAATAAAASKKPVATSAATAGAAKKPAPGGGKSSEEPVKFIYEDDTFASAVGEFISGEILEGLSSSQWKQRKEACEKLSEELKTNTSQVPEMELIVRQFSVKPGWKDSNVQVLGLMYGIMEYMASRDESVSLPTGAAALSIPPLAEKLGDAKLKTSSGSCLTAYCKHSSVQFVLSHSFPALAGIKAPKALADSIGWISATLLEFGVQGVKLRDIVDFVKSTGLSNSNAAVRTASIGLLGTLARFAGDVIRPLVEDISPQTMALVDAEFARVKDLPAPEVTQSCLWNSASGSSSGGGGGGGSGGNDVLDELFPRVNISSQLTSKLMQEMADSNWKQRKEALDTVTNIIAATNNRIEPPIGNLAESLKLRLSDVNKNLVLQTMGLVGVLATAMGKPFEKSAARVLTQPIMSCINDQKANMRAAAISALDQIYVACESSVEFAVNPAVTALNTDSSVLRKDLLTWLCAKTGATDDPQTSGVDTSSNLPDLSSWTSPLLACCQDRTVDARKLAQQLLGPVIRTCSFEHVWRAVNDLKGVSKNSVAPMVEVYKHLASSGTIAASSSPEVAPAGQAPPSNQQQSSQQPQQQPVPSQLNGGPGTARASASSQLQQRSRLAAPGASSLQRPMSTAASQRQSALPPASGMQQPSAGGAVRQLRQPGGGGVSGLQAPSSPHRGQPQQLQRPQATANAAASLQTAHQQQQQQQQQQPIEEGIPSHRLDVVISQIVNSDPYSSIEALRYLEPFLTNSEEYSDESAVISSLANCIDEIVGALTIAMRTAFTSDDKEIVGSQTHSRLCKSIVNCLLHVFNRRPLGAAVTQNTLHMTLSELLNRLLDPSISRLAIGPQLAKSVNLLVMRVLNGAERTAIFCVLVSLLEQSCSALANEQNKFTDLVQKCLWKITKTLRDDVRNDNIRINEVLLQVHKFMVTLPQSLWRELAKSDSTSGGGGGGEQTMQRDMPFRTVKTILHEIAITHGDAAWGYLDLIDNRHTSYVYTYLAALLDPSR
ncbi:ARM repeat-containing protein, partial [Ramicandelaber brevisporus]